MLSLWNLGHVSVLTSHISHAQQPHVASGGCIGQESTDVDRCCSKCGLWTDITLRAVGTGPKWDKFRKRKEVFKKLWWQFDIAMISKHVMIFKIIIFYCIFQNISLQLIGGQNRATTWIFRMDSLRSSALDLPPSLPWASWPDEPSTL